MQAGIQAEQHRTAAGILQAAAGKQRQCMLVSSYLGLHADELSLLTACSQAACCSSLCTREQAILMKACVMQPQPAEEATLQCWYMDDSDDDQRLPHQQNPNQPASISDIRNLGVVSWQLDADKFENDPKLEAIRKV